MNTVDWAKELRAKALEAFLNGDSKALIDCLDTYVGIIEDNSLYASEVWLEQPHGTDNYVEDCPTYYDGCKCTVNSLRDLIEVNNEQQDEIVNLRARIAKLEDVV